MSEPEFLGIFVEVSGSDPALIARLKLSQDHLDKGVRVDDHDIANSRGRKTCLLKVTGMSLHCLILINP